MDSNSIELDSRRSPNLMDQNFEPHLHQKPLPRPDGGKDAWLFLSACFMVEALVWGFPFTFGLFQEFYSTHEPFASSSGVAVIGTCAMVGCVMFRTNEDELLIVLRVQCILVPLLFSLPLRNGQNSGDPLLLSGYSLCVLL